MFERMTDAFENTLIRARIMLQRKVVEPLKETLENDDGMSELVQTLMITGIIVVAIGVIFTEILLPKLRDSATKTGEQIGGFDPSSFKP